MPSNGQSLSDDALVTELKIGDEISIGCAHNRYEITEIRSNGYGIKPIPGKPWWKRAKNRDGKSCANV